MNNGADSKYLYHPKQLTFAKFYLTFIIYTLCFQITTTLSSRVSFLRPAWNEAVQDFDAGFYKGPSAYMTSAKILL